MRQDDVVQIIDELERADVGVWVDGGWGVDALVAKETRPHSDLDLALDKERLAKARTILEEMGFRHDETADPGLPARLVMIDKSGLQVDLHPLRFDEKGDGWQQLSQSEEKWGHYPSEDLSASGQIGNRQVRCLSPELQLRFRKGYELRAEDEHDLGLLEDLLDRRQS
jgi:lincosamide nucleotidyltransferase A/C/D/E